MKACVLCNGVVELPDAAAAVARECDLIFAANGGTTHAVNLDLEPCLIVGDMDSLSPDLLERFSSVERLVYPASKDRSDAEAAVDEAFERGCIQVTLVGATGGRLDHTLGNIGLVARHPGRVAMADGFSTLVALVPGRPVRAEAREGTLLSLVALASQARGVSGTGLAYPLDDLDLSLGTRGISNVLDGVTATVSLEKGLLLCHLERGRLFVGLDEGVESCFGLSAMR